MKPNCTHVRLCAASVCLAASLILGQQVHAHGMIPHDVPVSRLVENLTEYVKAHPDDAFGHYRLGRVHMLALETKTGFALAFEGNELRVTEGSWSHRPQWGDDKKPENATENDLKRHLAEAVRHLNKAIAIRPAEASFRLTLACALEAGLNYVDEDTPWPLVNEDGNVVFGETSLSAGKQYEEQVALITEKPEWMASLTEAIRGYSRGSARNAIMHYAYRKRNDKDYKVLIETLRKLDWKYQIEEQYFTAMCYALPTNGKASEKPFWGGMDDWVSYEAGKDFIRVVEGREAAEGDVIRLRVAKETVQAFDDLPMPSAITPIVLDLAGRPLRELQTTNAVAFDLDGTGRPQKWNWINPDVGLLAWDPQGTGMITSGRQLFGSVSWWLFFDNGYQALDTLDNDRNGELTGAELDGLVLWFDRNENGTSDAGEVVPIGECGIVSLSCRATGVEGVSPTNATGVHMKDGRVLPSFDWIASSAAR